MLINLNGSILPASENHVHHTNRAFRYGDGIFESMAMFDGKVKLANLHQLRISKGAETIELELPGALNKKKFPEEIEKLRNANGFRNARIRLMLIRKAGGYYAPGTNEAEFLMEMEAVENNNYELNTSGLLVGFYDEILKPINILSNIKSCNALLYVKAGLYKNKKALDECIILNQKNNLCESISNNLFWIKDQIVYTPSPMSGCILGVMRNHLLQLLNANNIKCAEGEYTREAIEEADEVFLSGATKGIQWVKEIETLKGKIKYENKLTLEFFRLLIAS